MLKKSYLLTILIALSTLYAADDQGLTARENSGGMVSSSVISPSESSQLLQKQKIPSELEPYVKETTTSGVFRIFVTYSQYEALKGCIHASGLSFTVGANEAMESTAEHSQISPVSTLPWPSQELDTQTDSSDSLQDLTQSPNSSA